MQNYFDVLIAAEDVVKPKPDPEGINMALGMLGADKSQAVFLGDSNADIVAGKAAGLRTYGVHWFEAVQNPIFDVLPDIVFKSVPEFLDLMTKEER